jgi:hypothetical protein
LNSGYVCIFIDGVIPSEAALQAELGISRAVSGNAREIPRPAGENAGLRDDSTEEGKIQTDTLPVNDCA